MESTEPFDYPDLPAGISRDFVRLRGTPPDVVDFEEDFWGEELSDPERLVREPAVSVAVITYNHEKYIAKCLESILAQQTTVPFEIVVGEDCSTDQTRQIVLDFQRKYPETIRVFVSDCNVGFRRNRVRIGMRARGQFVAYCEGDDAWSDREKLQRQYDVMAADESIGLCFTDGVPVAEPGVGLPPFHLSAVKGGLSGVNEVYQLFMLRKISIPTASAMVRNFSRRWNGESLFRHFLFSLSMCDLPTWLLASHDRKTYYLPQKMITRHCHRDSLSQTWDREVALLDCFILFWYFANLDGELINKAALTGMILKYGRWKFSQRNYIQVWRALVLGFKCRLWFGRGGMARMIPGMVVRSAVARGKRAGRAILRMPPVV